MTIPPQNPFEHNPFGGAPFGASPSGPPVYSAPPVPPPDRPPVNALATLSVVFAFVFAPVGAVLGHLVLRQIRRTGERGRDRALVGTVLSYAVMIVVVGVLAVWLTRSESTPAPSGASSSVTAHPTVAPSDLANLEPTLDDVKTITGDQLLTMGEVLHRPNIGNAMGQTLDRPECKVAIDAGIPDSYNAGVMLGFYMPAFIDRGDPYNTVAVGSAVTAFLDPVTAQAQQANMLSTWSKCGAGSSVKVTFPDGRPFTFQVRGPNPMNNGVTTMEFATETELSVHAVATKSNVVIDLLVSYTGNGIDRARQTAVDVANQILNKIPG
ncbi:nuclease PIN [Mycobacterium colombiense]|uniref:Nuclease PIN n=1 Tax=Mycobacterium colombiense TaxID=339268 RepID=A0A329LQX0_9MYCO|nr:sensor domain-containing protein [Mycobacterium colombiense]RAV06927.1 nuclease PIN [Mycobacterium colombiense]